MYLLFMKRIVAIFVFAPHILLFLSSSPSTKNTIICDLYSRSQKKNLGALRAIGDLATTLMTSRDFRTLFYFRNPGIYTNVLRVFYPKERSFIIDRFSKIGPGLQLAHPYATIINVESMGTNCYINQLVTIGEKNGKKPIIGNNVQFLSNCTVIGGITIGDNAVIGAGAVVVKDVPAGAVVVGNPARIL